jgi:hypothetical protein
MNKMSQDKLFMIILVSVFAAGATFLGALKFTNVAGESHAAGGAHGGEAVAAADAHPGEAHH